MRAKPEFLLLIVILLVLSGCFYFSSSQGGGQTQFDPPRLIDPQDIALPAGYHIEAITTGLTFPTGATINEDGHLVVVESGYSYGEIWTTPRLLHIGPDGTQAVIAAGEENGPWTGVAFHEGSYYVAEGGVGRGGRILRITPDGKIRSLIDGLPGLGDHHTNGPVIHNGWLFWGQGTATNSGIVGPDNAHFGWLNRYPEFHDIPCRDVTLAGENFPSAHSLRLGSQAMTGAYSPFGTRTEPGQVIQGQLPCHGSVFRMPVGGGAPELVAWGFRNPFGLAFSPDGRLYVTDNSYDDRGSRPVFGAGDLLWEVQEDTWYGWPDFHGQHRLDSANRYTPPGKLPLTMLLEDLRRLPRLL